MKSIQQRPIREGGGVGVGGGCGAIATTQHHIQQEQITTANVTHMYLDRYDEFWDGDGSAGGHDWRLGSDWIVLHRTGASSINICRRGVISISLNNTFAKRRRVVIAT